MCSSYWTVSDKLICPTCGEEDTWEIQTHEYGQVGSCVNFYILGDRPEELAGIFALIFEDAWCPKCGHRCNAAITVTSGELTEIKLAPI